VNEAIVVRGVAAADLPALRQLIAEHQDYHRAIEPQWPAGAEMAAAYLTYLQAECAAQDGEIFLAFCGPTLVGFVCIVTNRRGAPDDPARHAFVHDLFVGPADRRRGIARRLMEMAEAFARSRGVFEVRLAVLEGNEEARAFYDALGFRGYARILTKRMSD
jgi:ribosomal protein S18 acetylase RimI-like enzyme